MDFQYGIHPLPSASFALEAELGAPSASEFFSCSSLSSNQGNTELSSFLRCWQSKSLPSEVNHTIFNYLLPIGTDDFVYRTPVIGNTIMFARRLLPIGADHGATRHKGDLFDLIGFYEEIGGILGRLADFDSKYDQFYSRLYEYNAVGRFANMLRQIQGTPSSPWYQSTYDGEHQTLFEVFTGWFWRNTVVDLGFEEQLAPTRSCYSKAVLQSPLPQLKQWHAYQLASIQHISLDLEPRDHHFRRWKYKQEWKRKCAFIKKHMSCLQSVTLWLKISVKQLVGVFREPEKQWWVRAFEEIQVQSSFELKLLIVEDPQNLEMEEETDVHFERVSLEPLKRLLLPLSLLGRYDEGQHCSLRLASYVLAKDFDDTVIDRYKLSDMGVRLE